MTGLEYMRTVCPTTKVGKDPLREDVADAFEDGIAEGWKQYKKKQWKPSAFHLGCITDAISMYKDRGINAIGLKEVLDELKKLREE